MAHYDPDNFQPRNSLGYMLKVTHSLLHDCGELVFANHDINFFHWITLIKLNEGVSLTASDLCREMRHDNGAFTRMIDFLEGLGYVHRQRSQLDRRAVDLQITEAGRTKLKELTPQVVANYNKALEALTPEEFASLLGLLNKLKSVLEDYTANPPTK